MLVTREDIRATVQGASEAPEASRGSAGPCNGSDGGLIMSREVAPIISVESASTPYAGVSLMKNLVANYLQFACAALANFLVSPILLAAFGTTGFGMWKSCQRIVELLLPGDGGPPQALKWLVANAGDDPCRKRMMVSAALMTWLRWLPAVAALSGVVVLLFCSLAETEVPATGEIGRLAVLLCIAALLSGLSAIPAAAMLGDGLGYYAAYAASAAIVLTSSVIALAAYTGYGLVEVAALTVGGALLLLCVTTALASLTLDWWGAQWPSEVAREQFARHSASMLVWSYVQKLLLCSEVLLLLAFLGAEAVSQCSFTAYASQFIPALCLLSTNAFLPQLATCLSGGDWGDANRLIRAIVELNAAIIMVAGAGILIGNAEFISVWAGDDQFLGDISNVLILVVAIQLIHIRLHAQLQDAALAARAREGWAVLGAVAGIAGGTLGWWALESVAGILAGLIFGRSILSFMFPQLSRRAIGAPGFSGLEPRHLLLPATVLLAAWALGNLLEEVAFDRLLIVSPALAALFIWLAWRFLLSEETRSLFAHNFLPNAGRC